MVAPVKSAELFNLEPLPYPYPYTCRLTFWGDGQRVGLVMVTPPGAFSLGPSRVAWRGLSRSGLQQLRVVPADLESTAGQTLTTE